MPSKRPRAVCCGSFATVSDWRVALKRTMMMIKSTSTKSRDRRDDPQQQIVVEPDDVFHHRRSRILQPELPVDWLAKACPGRPAADAKRGDQSRSENSDSLHAHLLLRRVDGCAFVPQGGCSPDALPHQPPRHAVPRKRRGPPNHNSAALAMWLNASRYATNGGEHASQFCAVLSGKRRLDTAIARCRQCARRAKCLRFARRAFAIGQPCTIEGPPDTASNASTLDRSQFLIERTGR